MGLLWLVVLRILLYVHVQIVSRCVQKHQKDCLHVLGSGDDAGGGLEVQKPRGQGSTGPEGAGSLLWWLQLCELLPTSQKAQLT